MIRPVLVVSLLAVSCPAVAQVKTFELGALRSDVHTEFGTPGKFFAPEPNRYLYGIQEGGYALHSRLPHILWLADPPTAHVLDHL